MAGPWEQYQQPAAATTGAAPWEQYAQPAAQPSPQPSAPPDSSGGVWNSLVSGYQNSATGLSLRGKLPDVVLDPSHTKWYEKTLQQVGQIIPDIPEMIAGSFVGGRVAGPIGGTAAAFAVPTAIRESLIQSYSKGEVQSSGDFLDRAAIVLKETGKSALVGAITGIAGKLAAPLGSLAQTGAEVGAMTVAPAALEGKLPEPQDFANAAILVGGMKTAGHVAGKLASIYAKTGVEPSQVVADAQADPSIKEDLVSGAEAGHKSVRDNLRDLLHNPSQSLIDKDIALNKLLGGENETLSARIGKAKDTSLIARVLANGLDSIDPGHTDRAVADIRKEAQQGLDNIDKATDIPKAYVPLAAADEAKNAFNGDKAQQVLDSPYADIPESKLPYQVNLKYVTGPDGLQALATRMSTIYKDDINEQRGGAQSHAETELKATQALNDLTGGEAAKVITGREPGTAANAVELKIRGDLMMQSTVDAGAAVKAYNEAKLSGTATDQMKLDALEAIHKSAMIQAEFTGAASEVGRSLEYLKRIKEMRNQGDRIKQLVSAYGSDPDTMLKLAGEIGTPEGMAKFAKEMTKATTYEKFIEAWKAGILSGPITHIANVVGNSTFMAMRPIVDMTSSAIGRLTGGERVAAAEPFARIFGNLQGAKDAIMVSGSAVKAAYEQGGIKAAAKLAAVEDQTGKAEQFQPAISGVKGDIIRLPFRALSLADDFFRTMNNQGERYALATRQALSEGHNLQTHEFRERVIDLVQNDSAIADKAHTAAERFTFNTPLGDKGQAVQNFVRKANLQLVVPFIRTPGNIFKEMVRMTPLAPVIGEWRAAFEAGGTQRAQAIAEMAMGTAISGVVASFVTDGSITGQGSADPAKRTAALASGWQPYSIKIGKDYYSYQRLQPLGTLIGMAADLKEVWENMTEEEGNKAAIMLSVAFANAVTTQTFLSGITNIVQVLADPTRYGSKFVQQYAGSVVPAGIAQLTQMNDPLQREVNGIIDAVKSRIPGERETLQPKVNPLTGQDQPSLERLGGIAPIGETHLSDDPVLKEALRLGVGVSKAPKSVELPAMHDKQLGSVQLTAEQRHDFASTAGKITHEALSNIVNSDQWESLPDIVQKQIFEKAIAAGRKVANAEALSPEQRQQEVQRIGDELQVRLQSKN